MDDALAHALVVVAALLMLLQFVSFLASAWIARQLRGREGGQLAAFLAIGTFFILMSQSLRLVHAILIDVDPAGSFSLRLRLFFAEQMLLFVCSIGLSIGAWWLWQRHGHRDAPRGEGLEPDESVGVEVDQIGAGAAVTVDDRDGDAS